MSSSTVPLLPITLIKKAALWALGGLGGVGLVTAALQFYAPEFASLFSDLGLLGLGVFTSGILAFAAWRAPTTRLRWAWGAIALAHATSTLGDGIWAWLELVWHLEPFPSIADPFYLLYYPAFIVGLFALPSVLLTWRDRIKVLLDISTMMVSASLVFWVFWLGPILSSGAASASPAELYLSLAYPLADLGLLSVLAAVLLRPHPQREQLALWLLTASVGSTIITDFFFSEQAIMVGAINSVTLNLGYYASLTLSLLAGLWQLRPEVAPSPTNRPSTFRWQTLTLYLPYVSFIVASGLLLVARGLDPAATGYLIYGAFGVSGLVLARQVLALSENQNLLHTEQTRRHADSVLLNLSQHLAGAVTEAQVGEMAMRVAVEAVQAEAGALLLSTTGALTVRGAYGLSLAACAALEAQPPAGAAAPRPSIIPAAVTASGLTASVNVPVMRAAQVAGVLLIYTRLPRPFSGAEMQLLTLIAHQIVIAFDRAELIETGQREAEARFALLQTVQRQLEELTLLHTISLAGTEALDEDALIERTLAALRRTLPVDSGGILLLDNAGERLWVHPSYHHRLGQPTYPSSLVDLEDGLTGEVARTGEPQRVQDVSRLTRYLAVDEATRSELCVPIKTAERVLGVINIESLRANAFSAADERLLMTLAGQLAIALEKVRLLNREQQRVAALKALHQIGLDLNAELDLNTLLHTIIERAAQLVEAPRSGLSLLEPDAPVLTLKVVYNMPAEYVGTRLAVGEGVVGRVAQTGAPYVIDDYQVWDERPQVYHHSIFRAVLGVPITWQGRVVGALTVNHDRSYHFPPHEIELVSLFADQAAMAIVNARLFEAERAQREFAEVLRQVGTLLNTSLDWDATLDQLLDLLARVVPFDAACVLILEADVARIARMRGYDRWGTDALQNLAALRLPLATTANLQHIAHTGQPHWIADTHYSEQWVAVSETSAHYRAWLGTPLIVQPEGLLGFFSLDNLAPDSFNAAHAARLSAFAAQAALALQNARLFSRTQQRELELRTLLTIARTLSVSLDARTVMRNLAISLCTAFDMHRCGISLLDPATRALTTTAVHYAHGGRDTDEVELIYALDDYPLTAQVVDDNRTILVRADDPTADPGEIALLRSFGDAQMLMFSLRAGGRVEGLAELFTQDPHHVVTHEHLQLIEGLADQVGLALANMRLYEAERQERAHAQILQAALTALSTTFDLPTQLRLILEYVAHLFPFPSGAVWLVEADQARLMHTHGYGERVLPEADTVLTLAHSPSAWPAVQRVIESQQPYLSLNTTLDPLWAAPAAFAHIRAWLGAPLLLQNQVYAVIALEQTEAYAFLPWHAQRLTRFLGQLALAVQNADLFQAQAQYVRELEALHQASLSLTASLELRPLLEAILRTTLQFTPGAQDAHIFLYHPTATPPLEFGVALEQDGTPKQLIEAPRPDGLTATVAREGRLRVVTNMATDPLFQTAPHRWRGAIVGIPLKIGQRVVGVMNIGYPQPRAMPETEERVLRFLADQAAIAIENARLVAETQNKSRDLELLYTLSQSLTATLHVRAVAERALQKLSEILPITHGFVAVPIMGQTRWEVLALTGGVPATVEDWNRHWSALLNRGLTGWVTQHRAVALIEEVTLDVRWAPVYGLPETLPIRAAAGLPLLVGDRLVGTLLLLSTTLRGFHAAQQPLLTAVAASIAVALQNAQLFERTEHHAKEVTAVSQVLHTLNSAIEVGNTFESIDVPLRTITRADHVSLNLFDAARQTFGVMEIYAAHAGAPLAETWPLHAAAAYTTLAAGREHLTLQLEAEAVQFEFERALSERGLQVRLSLPLRVGASNVGAQVLGALTLAWSHPEDYAHINLPLLTQMADAIALALEKNRLFNETRRRDAILKALAYAGARLLMPGHLGEVLFDVLAHLAKAMQLGRATIFENIMWPDGVQVVSQTYEWAATPALAQHAEPRWQHLPYAAAGLSRWAKVLMNGESLAGLPADFLPEERGFLQARGTRAMALAPIFSGGAWWGFVAFDDCADDRRWPPAELEAIKSLADSLGAAFARQRSENAEREERALAEALRDTAAALNSTLNFDEVLQRIMSSMGRVVAHDAATIMLVKARVARIVRGEAHSDNPLTEDWAAMRLTVVATQHLRRIWETGKSLIIAETAADAEWEPPPEAPWAQSYAGTPVKQKGRLMGFINLYSATPGFFTTARAERLRAFTDQAGVAIENAQFYEELERRIEERTHALAAANARLQQLDELKDQFISTVSHELRTPLTNIKLHLGLLEKRGPEALGRHLPTLQRETERLRGLIEDLLNLSRLQTQSIPLKREPHLLDDLLTEVVTLQLPRAEAKNQELIHRQNLGLLEAPIDRAEIMQVFTNLVGNAVAYAPLGARITITSQPHKLSGRLGVVVRFNNSRPVIPVDDLPHLFERFYRGLTGRDSGEPGTGLGLAICKEIVERHAGRLEVESNEAEGTTFTVWLPMAM